jgi:hypothetical protein
MAFWSRNDSNIVPDGLFTNTSECEKYLKNLNTEQDSNEIGEYSSRLVMNERLLDKLGSVKYNILKKTF